MTWRDSEGYPEYQRYPIRKRGVRAAWFRKVERRWWQVPFLWGVTATFFVQAIALWFIATTHYLFGWF